MKSRIIRKILAVCLSAALMFQVGGAAFVFALDDIHAAPKEVINILTDVKFTVSQASHDIAEGGTLNPIDPIRVYVSFGVPVDGDLDADPDAINAGDTTTFILAAGLIGTCNDKPLLHNGQEVGTMTITYNPDTEMTAADGITIIKGVSTAVVTFSALVDNMDYNTVSADFIADLSYVGGNSSGDVGDHAIQILEKDFKVVVPEKKTTITVAKEGAAEVGNGVVSWKVKVVPVIEGGGTGSLESCTFTDDLTDVGTYVDNSFKLGTTDDTTAAADAAPTNTAPALTYNFSAADTGVKYIFFQTKIPQAKLEGPGKQTINNTAKVITTRSNVNTVDGSGKAEFERRWIEKNGRANNETTTGGIYDPANQTITWTITANHDGVSLTDVVITDVLPDELTWNSAKLETSSDGVNWTRGITFTTAPAEGKYSIGDISAMVKLTIIAKVKDTDPPSGVTNYKNTAKIHWKAHPEDISSKEVSVGVGFEPVKKEASVYNAATHTVDWIVTVNARGQSYGADNLRVLDLLVYGESGFNVNDTYTISAGSTTGLFDVAATVIKDLTPSYNQKYAGDFDDASSGLEATVHTVKKDGKPVADLLVVAAPNGVGIDNAAECSFSYKSIVTNPKLYAGSGSKSVTNTTSMFSADTRVSSAPATQSFTSHMLTKNMVTVGLTDTDAADPVKVNGTAGTAGGFNYVDQSIYFKLHVNGDGISDITNDLTTADGDNLGDLVVTDTLPAGWEFQQIDGKDFLLFEGVANAKGLVTAMTAVTDYDAFLSGRVAAAGTMSLTFTQLTKPYVILLKAGPAEAAAKVCFSKNGTTTVTNNAKITANSVELAKESEKAQITSSIVAKSVSTANADCDGYLKWTVNYNPYGFEHTGAYLEDVLPDGLDLRTDSSGRLDLINDNITINELALKQDGSYIVGSELVPTAGEVSYNPQSRVIRFQIPDTKKAYQFTYITDVTGTTGNVNNKVSLKAGDAPVAGTEAAQHYSISQFAARASFQRSGWLLLKKENDSGLALMGAEFKLFAADGITEMRSGTTDSNGKLYLKVLPVGTYILKETVPPTGYTLDGLQRQVVVVSDGSGGFTTKIGAVEVQNEMGITIINYTTGTVGALRIEKMVSGSGGDVNRKFEFILTLSDTTGIYAYTGDGVSDGTIKSGDAFSLAHGQSITVAGLPKDTTYTVIEKDYSADGYTTTKRGDNGKIHVDSVQTAIFTNTSGAGGVGDAERPNDQTEPMHPTEPQVEPTKPVMPPIPGYLGFTHKPEAVPDPDLQGSPEQIIVIDESGTSLGIYTKHEKPDGSFEYIDDEGIPIGAYRNAQTGNAVPIKLLIALFVSSLCASGVLVLYKKRRSTK